MIKKINRFTLFLLLSLFTVLSINAEEKTTAPERSKGRVIGGLGLIFDLNGLGGTVVKDGLNSGMSKTSLVDGSYIGQQTIIIPENKLMALDNMTGGVFAAKTNGAMTGGNINIGYERDFGSYFFARASVSYTSKIRGGHTESSFMGYRWYDITWNYHATVVPVYVGMKYDFNDKKQSLYIGAGVHYFRAAWEVKGTNDGAGIRAATGGLAASLPVVSDGLVPGGRGENMMFSGNGFGVNWLIGGQSAISEKGYIFMEVETLISMTYGTAGAKTMAGISSMSPYPVYPVSVAGQYYRIGYKHDL